jgi:hypothetical protein
MSKSLEEMEAFAKENEKEFPVKKASVVKTYPRLVKDDEKCRHGVYNCKLPHPQEDYPTDSSFWWTGILVFAFAGGYIWLVRWLS